MVVAVGSFQVAPFLVQELIFAGSEAMEGVDGATDFADLFRQNLLQL